MFRRRFLQTSTVLGFSGLGSAAWAHHGWSSFDQNRPIYLEGRAVEVKWRNPHAELVLELPEKLTLPADLAQRALPTRRDRRWEIELAPLFRLGQWQMPESRNGAALSMVGFTFKDEQGAAVLRAEYVFLDGKAYGLRSGPA